jgi:hypothetical protein
MHRRLAEPLRRARPLGVRIWIPEVAKEPRRAHTEDTIMQTETMQLRELTVRYSVKKGDVGEPVMVPGAVTTPAESAAVLMPLLQHEATEVFAILCL